MPGADPRSSVAPDEERLYGLDGLAPLGDFPQGGAKIHFDNPGVRYGAAHRHETRPRFFGQPAGAERTGTVAGDESDVGQRLCVVHQSGSLPYA